MKILSRGILIRLIFVALVAVSAYLLGHRHPELQSSALDSTTKHTRMGQAHTVTTATPPASITPARKQEWEQLKTVLYNPNHSVLLQSLFKLQNQLAEADPLAIPFLLEQVASLPPGYGRDIGLERLFMQILSYNPPKTLPFDLSQAYSMTGLISDPKASNDMFNRILSYAARSDPNSALAELAKLPSGPQTQTAYHSVFFAIAGANSEDGASAATVAFNLPLGAERTQALNGVVEGWIGGNSHPNFKVTEAALNWASSLPPEDLNVVLNSALYPTANQKPALAAQYVDKLTDASVRNTAIQSIARIWGTGVFESGRNADPAAAIDWLNQVATGDTYDTNVKYIFSKLNPATAAPLISKVTEPGVREAVIATVANAWGSKDPQATLAWLQSLPDSDSSTRDPLVQKLLNP